MACISLPSLAGQGHMESRWAWDESPWPLASRPLAAAALSSRSTVAKLCPPAITVKACRPPTDAWRARRVKPPIPNQDDRYHPLACIPTHSTRLPRLLRAAPCRKPTRGEAEEWCATRRVASVAGTSICSYTADRMRTRRPCPSPRNSDVGCERNTALLVSGWAGWGCGSWAG